ncbi:glycosyltransferase [Pseudonocardia sp. KRD-184]|uniref:Glycosyltransferase n=1 Tax=Pseudonocardia oceani TaxID=2792013 RepID=A0ABS6UD23_9PSEU|nr:glycosyltransferase [Pseudonocardia oceani]MBW0093041.1 glycosyltransferase [Pseudonocardia oceani]MBW0100064.1 glycosyltransferase [Pseudonocardia oceani]MBW0112706.1 glycosyltransferase [Pseudonocardia oceani]MBW0124168.1 glycosyltransferase [Pseudonocardia oceani]MBW0130143.1 glycosyltransferase [Pseudonocardia oceani]
MKRHRIALIASARYPIREPFAGGLEAHTWQLASRLRARGHEVTVFGGAGSDPALGVREMTPLPPLTGHARSDVSMPADWFLAEHHAYLGLMLELSAPDAPYDVVHNNSLHYLPVAMGPAVPRPVVTTLHTPPTPWLESAIRLPRTQNRPRFAAVSHTTAGQWRGLVPDVRVVRNGVDTAVWTPGPGGGTPVWSGRIVPEKGPVEAIRAARAAGSGLRLAGPRPDRRWFDAEVAPLLGDGIDYVGHLDHTALARLVGSASVAVVSPCWDEPYGLVVAEALACGTPIAGFARGALPELLGPTCGVLADPGDVDGLAAAIPAAARLDRAAVRRRAEDVCSVEAMVRGYEDLYDELVA